MSDQEQPGKRLANGESAKEKALRQRTDLSQATSYTGSCEDMCPERERNSRLGQRTSIFERDPITNVSEEYAMVKEYRRAGADQEEPAADDLRTPNALKNTVDYLVSNIMDDERSKSLDYALEWYDFLWDRLRAVRKDITQQNICNQLSAILVEQCTRFHVHSCYALNRIKDFDVNMNKRNLNDCLQMLRQIYQDLKDSFGITCIGEFEFKKYNILLHLGEDALTTNSLMKEADNRSMKEAKLITDLFNSYSNNNYFKFFKLMQEADYMTSCILSLYVNKVRLNAMKTILAACNLKQPILYPAQLIIESLAFDNVQDLFAFASHFEVEFQTKDSIDYLILKREHIEVFHQLGSSLPEVKSRRLVEDKMLEQSVGQLVYGQAQVPSIKPIPIRHEMISSGSPERISITENEFKITNKQLVDECSIPSRVLTPQVRIEPEQEETNRSSDESSIDSQGEKDTFTNFYHDERRVVKTNTINFVGSFNEIPVSKPIPIESEVNSSCEDTSFIKNDSETIKKLEDECDNQLEELTPDVMKEPELKETGLETDTCLNLQDQEDPYLVLYTDERRVAHPKASRVSFVADLMPAGKLRRSKRLMPKFAPIPQDPKKVVEKVKNARKESKRTSDINSIKEWASEEGRANQELFRIVRMVI